MITTVPDEDNDDEEDEDDSTTSSSSSSSRRRSSSQSSGGSTSGGGFGFNISGVDLNNKEFNLTGNSSFVWLNIFAPSRNLYSVKISDEEIGDEVVPSSMSEFSEVDKTTYENAKINSSYLDNEDIKKATVKFVIQKEWLTNNNIEKEIIELVRFSSNGTKLDTKQAKLVKENISTVTYQSDFDGFGLFKILGQNKEQEKIQPVNNTPDEIIEERNVDVEQPLEEQTTKKEQTNIPPSIPILAVILLLILIGIGIYLYSKRKD